MIGPRHPIGFLIDAGRSHPSRNVGWTIRLKDGFDCMALTTTQRQALLDALASVNLTEEYNGMRRTRRSVDELIKALGYDDQAKAAADSSRHTISSGEFTRD